MRDTTHFLKKLRNVSKIPKNSFMVTMGVHSLYDNVDHEEGAEACFHALKTQSESSFIKNIEINDIIYS